eukprot:5147676-Amphidinium_carterae.2
MVQVRNLTPTVSVAMQGGSEAFTPAVSARKAPSHCCSRTSGREPSTANAVLQCHLPGVESGCDTTAK